ncbi:MAG: hypothetical protein M3024_16190 [Candidatus Dormibacteraeota bacterium]|nr:hypothetical protein [Candidatus Dormibacteraeota bacterium]
MAESNGPDVVVEVSRVLVTRLAPEELPLFHALSGLYLANPAGLERGGRERDEVLGFGVEGASMLVTPVVLTTVAEVVKHVVEQLAVTGALQGLGSAGSALHRVFHLSRGAPAAPALTAAQLAAVRQVALEKATAMRLPQARAGLLADAIVGSLASPAPE